MPEILIGLLFVLVAGLGYFFMMRLGRTLDQKRIVSEMEADLLRIEAEFCHKCATAGELAFKNDAPSTSNPYIFANTNKPSGKFADYWNRGYVAAAEKAAASDEKEAKKSLKLTVISAISELVPGLVSKPDKLDSARPEKPNT